MMTAPTPVAIFDVDGTLCDVTGVRHYVLADRKRRDFESFHKASAVCPPNPEAVQLAKNLHDAGVRIVVVTARKEKWRVLTATWLRKWEVPYDALLMRADADGRQDAEVKRDILRRLRECGPGCALPEHRLHGSKVILAVDDNPTVIDLWRSEGIPVVVIPGWQTEGPTHEQVVDVLNARLQVLKATGRPGRDTREVMNEGRR